MGAHDLRFGGSYTSFLDHRSFGAFQNSVLTLGHTLGHALDNLMIGQVQTFQGAGDGDHLPLRNGSVQLRQTAQWEACGRRIATTSHRVWGSRGT